MALYRNVHLSFWEDPKVVDDFTPEDKYFFVYVLTNPHTNIVGCYEVSTKQIERETGYNEDTVYRLLKRMEEVHEVIRYDKKTKEILILNWYKYNWTKSPKCITAAVKGLKTIKSEDFKSYINTLLIPYLYGIDTTDTDTDTDAVTDTKADISKDLNNTNIGNKSTKAFEKDTDAYKAARFLAKAIKKNYPQLKEPEEKDLQRWAADFDKCNRIDGYDWDIIADVLAFSQKDSFWRQNIRSGEKFRKQFDMLLIKMKETNDGKRRA